VTSTPPTNQQQWCMLFLSIYARKCLCNSYLLHQSQHKPLSRNLRLFFLHLGQ
jgi:hypothetical protein